MAADSKNAPAAAADAGRRSCVDQAAAAAAAVGDVRCETYARLNS